MTRQPRVGIIQLDAATLTALAAGHLDEAQRTSPVETPDDLPWVNQQWDDEDGLEIIYEMSVA